MYDTNTVWNELALTGRASAILVSEYDAAAFGEQIRAEAEDEGVRVRVDVKFSKVRCDYTAYVYLRKNS